MVGLDNGREKEIEEKEEVRRERARDEVVARVEVAGGWRRWERQEGL